MRRQLHRLTDINENARLATCGGCGPSARIVFKPHKGYWVCRVADARRSEAATVARRRRQNLKAFGLSEAAYDALLAEQAGVCAICSQSCSTGRRLAVDHDHETGRVRGLLCGRCNRALGLLRDDPSTFQKAAAYLAQ
jgi:hypothetical protein